MWAKEPIGTTALALSAGLTILIGGFFWFISRRIDARPEDRKDAEMADGAGELGFFSPASYWPITHRPVRRDDRAGAGVLLPVADHHRRGAPILLAVGGLLFEYYVGQNAHS